MQNVSKSPNRLSGSFPCERSSFGPMVRVVGSEVTFMIRYQEMPFSSPPLLEWEEVLDFLRVCRHLPRIYKQQATVNHWFLLQFRDLSP